MRQLLCVALLLLCFAYGGIAGVSEYLPQSGTDLWFTYVPYKGDIKRHDHGYDWKPIRIAVNLGSVLDGINACGNADGSGNGRYNAGEFPKIDGKICEIIGSLGTEKAVEYYKEVVVKAVKLHADRLLVKPARGNLRISEYGSSFPEDGPCKGVTLNPSDSGSGVEDADVAIYVDLTAHHPVTHICKYDEKGRPIAANIRLRPQDLLSRGEGDVRFLAHHIAHAIGFDTILKEIYGNSKAKKDHEGAVKLEIERHHTKKGLRDYFGCDVSVIEMERASRHNHQVHFPSSFVEGELMGPHDARRDSGADRAVYSPLTLAVLESTGFFRAEYHRAVDGEGLEEAQKQRVCEAQRL